MMGAPRSQHYAAAKGAVISLMRTLAVELARNQVRVNAIVPGWIDTPMTAKALHGEAFTQKVLPRVPLRRWGVGEDFGGIAVYLASDLSAYHTGDTLDPRRRVRSLLADGWLTRWGHVERHLLPGERVLYKTRLHWVLYTRRRWWS